MSVRGVVLGCLLVLLSSSAATAGLRERLIASAATDVPASANRAYKSLATNGPLHVISGVTGVEFHVPGVVSSARGGLSATPHPIAKVDDGVSYWLISGELSGYLTDDLGNRAVIGPIDRKGKNHRAETWTPDSGAHPRAGLPGAFFALRMPASGFNGGLIQIEAAGDGGFLYPAAPMLFNPVDPMILLARGYAVFTFGQGGTVHDGVLPDGTHAVDTNPESGSGIFFQGTPGNYDDPIDLVGYDRVAFIDDKTGVETSVPSDFSIDIVDGVDESGHGQIFSIPFGDPNFYFGSIHQMPELISDSVILAKNLVREAFPGKSVGWASYVGWSGSGRAAVLINSNTRSGAFQVAQKYGPQAGGGAYNVWGQPSSGLRFDSFVVYAAANDSQGYTDRMFGPTDVNPRLPASAPFVWLVPDCDSQLPQAAAYQYANRIWRALAALGRPGDINDLFRIYSVGQGTHQARDQLYSASDSPDGTNGLWYDLQDRIPNPGAFNQARRGLRVSGPYAQALQYDGPIEGWDYFFHGKAAIARDTPLWLQTFANLRDQAERGRPLPVSRVDPKLFDDPQAISTATALPHYPVVPFTYPDPWSDDAFFAEVYGFEHSITEISGESSNRLTQLEVDDLKLFAASNPLVRSTRPLVPPDAAVPLGLNFFEGNLIFQAPFSDAQLRARYRSHEGYVLAFAAATGALVEERLWDPRLAAAHVWQAVTSSVLLPRGR